MASRAAAAAVPLCRSVKNLTASTLSKSKQTSAHRWRLDCVEVRLRAWEKDAMPQASNYLSILMGIRCRCRLWVQGLVWVREGPWSGLARHWPGSRASELGSCTSKMSPESRLSKGKGHHSFTLPLEVVGCTSKGGQLRCPLAPFHSLLPPCLLTSLGV